MALVYSIRTSERTRTGSEVPFHSIRAVCVHIFMRIPVILKKKKFPKRHKGSKGQWFVHKSKWSTDIVISTHLAYITNGG